MRKLLSISMFVFFLFGCESDKNEATKIVYIDNFKVFDSFEMKKDYDKILEKEVSEEKMSLDALASSISLEKEAVRQAEMKKTFFEKKQVFEAKFQQLSEKYTNMVYERLNEYIKDYGKKNKCSLILGTTGQGNVMFVDEKVDVTKEIIKYVNGQYND